VLRSNQPPPLPLTTPSTTTSSTTAPTPQTGGTARQRLRRRMDVPYNPYSKKLSPGKIGTNPLLLLAIAATIPGTRSCTRCAVVCAAHTTYLGIGIVGTLPVVVYDTAGCTLYISQVHT
jgi:hypothetical protein